mmetsp:Transcript_22100/g.89583  ORF Transcript_22100/g.89583 Transcript_22100/m.89583 type:complete len:80 (-) Transcript_22100:582-821(-)
MTWSKPKTLRLFVEKYSLIDCRRAIHQSTRSQIRCAKLSSLNELPNVSTRLLVDLKKWYLGAERNYDLLIRFNERPVSY